MEELSDEQIQSLLENGLNTTKEPLSAIEQEQMDSYFSLFQKLKTEPADTLPFNFAAEVTRQLKLRLKYRSDLKFSLFSALGIIIGLIAAYGLLSLVKIDAGEQFLTAMLKLKWLLLTGVVILSGTLVFDLKIVQENPYNNAAGMDEAKN
ncbi:hypothetical protein [Pedobacter cryoconitis]|uniref:Uncharacterized protein n=1 Tax=Pedobacter cryoconitis TaxID=188932 RepID=A0A327SDE2_9SPHI|nr:hypothetical protein [Pedobacter cryoconitis]RAJ26911.1 hypothetical protein LY11_03737 [Pedobacter cryoconitis]